MASNVQIKGEADGSELSAIISDFALESSKYIYTDNSIRHVLDCIPKGVGYWLKNSTPDVNGNFRGECHNGIIVHAVRRPEFSGEAFGRSFTEEEHYDIYVKFDGPARAAIADQLGLPVKNG